MLVIAGTAAISADPPADERPDYTTKYATLMAKNGWTAAGFAALYSVALRIEPRRVHGW